MEEKKLIDANDTNLIKSTFKFLQTLNAVVYAILMFVMFVLTIAIATEDEVLWLLPLVAAAVFTLAFFIIKNQLVVKFGLYYDVRVLRLNNQQMPKLSVDEIDVKKTVPNNPKKLDIKSFDIKSNEDFEKMDVIYQEATQKMTKGNESNSVEFYKEALALFDAILDYKNTVELVAYCERKILELEKKN